MSVKKKTTYADKIRYATPLLDVISAEECGMLCQSATNESFIDNPNPVDWFAE